MMPFTRRRVLEAGGVFLAASCLGRSAAKADEVVEIAMQGNEDGSKVWFDPIGIHIEPGRTVRWTNRDPGNSHTASAYHPEVFERPLRIPAGATPWDSDYLLPDESFSATFAEEGVYDYCCVPHEHAGMVGRIVVGQPGTAEPASAESENPLPEVALQAFPSVEEILEKGIVRPA